MAAMLRRRFSNFRERLARPRRPEGAGDAEPAEATEPPAGPVRPRLVVGLGNPDSEYRGNRHNVGAWCVELLAKRRGTKLKRERRAWSATVDLDGRALHLAWPCAYVNESGRPVASELARLGLRRQELLVIYDELDLPLGQLRIRPHGGHGGHNGMRSLLDALGGGDFPRIRVGIDRPYDDGKPVRDPERVAAWVLSNPPPREREALDAAVARAADAVELAALEGIEVAMTRLNASG